MTIKDPLAEALTTVRSGSHGVVTWARNPSGPYARRRTKPNNPTTAPRTAVRNLIGFLSGRWASIFLAPLRPAWQMYADNQPLHDKLGDLRHRTGREHYIRANLPRGYFGLRYIDVAPSEFRLPAFTPPTVIARVFAQYLEVRFETTDPWVSETGSALLIRCSPPTRTTINFYAGPYLKAGAILGNSTTPPTSPIIVPTPYPLSLPNNVHLAVRCTRADGRLSTIRRVTGQCWA